MKGKVILELEEYETLKSEKREQEETINKELKELHRIKTEIDTLIVTRKRYFNGYTEYYVPDDVAVAIETIKKNIIKTMSVKEFKELKR